MEKGSKGPVEEKTLNHFALPEPRDLDIFM